MGIALAASRARVRSAQRGGKGEGQQASATLCQPTCPLLGDGVRSDFSCAILDRFNMIPGAYMILRMTVILPFSSLLLHR